MSLFGAIARGLSAPVQRSAGGGVPAAGILPPLGSIPSAAGVLISQATAMSIATVYSCVRFRSVDMARCTPSLYRLGSDGSQIPVTDHPVAMLLRRPNRQQTWFEFARQMQMAQLLRGNAYAAIRRDSRGNPIELIPINPDAVLVLEAMDGSVFYSTNRIGLWQMAMLQDFPVTIPQEDMFHWRGLTFNTLVGASVIALARDSLGLAMGQEQQAARWIKNGARVSGLIRHPKTLSEPAAARLKASLQELWSGIQNTGTTAILEEGMEYTPMSLTAVDLEFLSSRTFQAQDVCRWFAVPPNKVGIPDKVAAKNIAESEQEYVNSAIAPDLDLWEQRLEFTFDLDNEDLHVDLDESPLLRADIATRFNAYRTGIMSSVLKPDEARRRERLPAVGGWAADLQRPSNIAALGSDVAGVAPDGAGNPVAGTVPDPGVSTGGSVDDSAPGG
jgi:HK97 family phage portal protein